MQRFFPIKTSAQVMMIQPLRASSHGFVMGGLGAGGAQRTEDLQRSLPALSPVVQWMEQLHCSGHCWEEQAAGGFLPAMVTSHSAP